MSLMKDRARELMLDAFGEGGLSCELDRFPMTDQPTLIIGLGGTGIDALLEFKKRALRSFTAPVGRKLPDQLAFIAADTDPCSFTRMRAGDACVDANEWVDLYEPNLAQYMRSRDLIPRDYLRDWLCDGINADNICIGTGGVRQLGRFMFISRAQAFIDSICLAAGRICAADGELPVNVYILTGVCGGTGSGMFLDAAYLARHILEERLHKRARLRGFIFMPDVNLCRVHNPAVHMGFVANGYAALRELDFWMNRERGRDFRQQYSDAVVVDTPEAPFELSCMISAEGDVRGGYEGCMRSASEILLGLLTKPERGAQRLDDMIAGMPGMLRRCPPERGYCANYVHAAMGVNVQRTQQDAMVSCLGRHMLRGVMKLSEPAAVHETEVKEFFAGQKLGLNGKNSLLSLFERRMRPEAIKSVVKNLDDFKAQAAGYRNSDLVHEAKLVVQLDMWVKHNDALYCRVQGEVFEEAFAALKAKIEQLFTDSNYGPFYARRMLNSGEAGGLDLLKLLEREAEAAAAALDRSAACEAELHRKETEALDEVRRNLYNPFRNAHRFNAYIEALFRHYDYKRLVCCIRAAAGVYRKLIEAVREYSACVTERFEELLTELDAVLQENHEAFLRLEAQEAACVKLDSCAKISEAVQAEFRRLGDTGRLKNLTGAFLSHMLREREAWVGGEGGLAASFSRFVCERFDHLLNRTMDESCMAAHALSGNTALYDHLCDQLLPELRSGAYRVESAHYQFMHRLSGCSAILCPGGDTVAGRAANDFALKCNAAVFPVRSRNSLCWIEFRAGLPLFSCRNMEHYMRNHDIAGSADHHRGRYLDKDWPDFLPPVMPQALWEKVNYKNERWCEEFESVRSLFAQAWENGLVAELESTEMVCTPVTRDGYINRLHVLAAAGEDVAEALIERCPLTAGQRRELREKGASAQLQADAKAAAAYAEEADAFLENGWVPDRQLKLKSDVFDLLMHDRRVEISRDIPLVLAENLLWTPDLAVKLARQLKLKKELAEAARLCRSYAEREGGRGEEESFAKALACGLYRVIGPRMFCLDDGDAPVLLMGIADYSLAPPADPVYAMYRKYLSFGSELKERMRSIAEARAREGVFSADLAQKMLVRVERRLNEISFEPAFRDEEMRAFYEKMRTILRSCLKENA